MKKVYTTKISEATYKVIEEVKQEKKNSPASSLRIYDYMDKAIGRAAEKMLKDIKRSKEG